MERAMRQLKEREERDRSSVDRQEEEENGEESGVFRKKMILGQNPEIAITYGPTSQILGIYEKRDSGPLTFHIV